jgi:Cu/Ag efflux pump CusA
MKLPISLTSPWSYVASAAGILLLIAAIIFGTVQCKKIDTSNHEKVVQTGVTKEKEQNHQEVIKHVEEAHEAVTNPAPAELDKLCSTYDRNCPNRK